MAENRERKEVVIDKEWWVDGRIVFGMVDERVKRMNGLKDVADLDSFVYSATFHHKWSYIGFILKESSLSYYVTIH